jgi:hypothetical protein
LTNQTVVNFESLFGKFARNAMKEAYGVTWRILNYSISQSPKDTQAMIDSALSYGIQLNKRGYNFILSLSYPIIYSKWQHNREWNHYGMPGSSISKVGKPLRRKKINKINKRIDKINEGKYSFVIRGKKYYIKSGSKTALRLIKSSQNKLNRMGLTRNLHRSEYNYGYRYLKSTNQLIKKISAFLDIGINRAFRNQGFQGYMQNVTTMFLNQELNK